MSDYITLPDKWAIDRAKFEEWFDSQGLWRTHIRARDRKPTGEYEDSLAEREWKKWLQNNSND